MTYFKAYCHGGACCGIKHIWYFPHSPNDLVFASSGSRKTFQAEGSMFSRGNAPFIDIKVPNEKARERLKRTVDEIIRLRPSGLIEISLTDYQTIQWKKDIEELGFKHVTKFYNSNSKNNVNIYHLTYKNRTIL